MSYYAVSAVRLNGDRTRITHVIWEYLGSILPMEYIPTKAPVAEVIDALMAGDRVTLMTPDKSGTWINIGAEFKPFTYLNGTKGITNNKIALDRLPTF